jgi:hypothetical protein
MEERGRVHRGDRDGDPAQTEPADHERQVDLRRLPRGSSGIAREERPRAIESFAPNPTAETPGRTTPPTISSDSVFISDNMRENIKKANTPLVGMGVASLGRHLIDVVTILALGLVYMLALSVETAVTTVHRRVTSAFTSGEHDQRPVEVSH